MATPEDDAKLNTLLDALDTDGSGTLTYDEFNSGLRHVHKQMDLLDIKRRKVSFVT